MGYKISGTSFFPRNPSFSALCVWFLFPLVFPGQLRWTRIIGSTIQEFSSTETRPAQRLEIRPLRSARSARRLPAPCPSAGDGRDGRTFPRLLAFSFNSLEVFAIPARLPAGNGPCTARACVRGCDLPTAAGGSPSRTPRKSQPLPLERPYRVPSRASDTRRHQIGSKHFLLEIFPC